MNRYIDQHRDLYGVEPICKVLQVAPSAYRRYAARCRNPALRSPRAILDEQRKVDIYRVWEKNFRVYGARKVWRPGSEQCHYEFNEELAQTTVPVVNVGSGC